MNSGEFVSMAEPVSIGTSLYGLFKWSSAGIGGGLAYAVAAIETNPEKALAITPQLDTSVYALALAVVAYVLKAYVPSEKKVDSQFEGLKANHQTLFDRLETLALEGREEAKERRDHYAMLHRWMGGVDEKLSSMSGNLEDVTGRLVRIERSQRDSGEIRRPTQ